MSNIDIKDCITLDEATNVTNALRAELNRVKDLNDLKSEAIQKLEAELKKRDELIKKAFVLIEEIDDGYPRAGALKDLFYTTEIKAILGERDVRQKT